MQEGGNRVVYPSHPETATNCAELCRAGEESSGGGHANVCNGMIRLGSSLFQKSLRDPRNDVG
jgi:hypothetical protein